jgi:hypothetical protein
LLTGQQTAIGGKPVAGERPPFGLATAKQRTMNLAGTLIAVSLILLAALGVAALFLAGTRSAEANLDDPAPRDRPGR